MVRVEARATTCRGLEWQHISLCLGSDGGDSPFRSNDLEKRVLKKKETEGEVCPRRVRDPMSGESISEVVTQFGGERGNERKDRSQRNQLNLTDWIWNLARAVTVDQWVNTYL